MVFTIVTIIFLPMSFIASFFAINFEDWGDRLTIDYVSRYMFPIGLAISFIFVTAAFRVEDISDVWKNSVRGIRPKVMGVLRGKGGRNPSRSRSPGRGASRGEEESKATWAGIANSGTWKSTADETKDPRPRGRGRTAKQSLERDLYRGPSVGFSPLRNNGARDWRRASLDGWRDRFSGDIERGRDATRLA